MEEKRTVPLPADPAEARRGRTVVAAGGAVAIAAVAVASVVAVSAGSSSPRKPVLGAAAASNSSADCYSQQPRFTYSARPGEPPAPTSPSTHSAPLAQSSPPSAPADNPAQAASSPAPPKTVTKTASAPAKAAPPPSSSKAPAPYQISGTISCLSGQSVEGVWVQAAQGSGYSPWQGTGDGSTARYWYTLPSETSFSLHVGCGGTPDTWGISVSTPLVPGPVADFMCHDVAGQADYGGCELR